VAKSAQETTSRPKAVYQIARARARAGSQGRCSLVARYFQIQTVLSRVAGTAGANCKHVARNGVGRAAAHAKQHHQLWVTNTAFHRRSIVTLVDSTAVDGWVTDVDAAVGGGLARRNQDQA